MKKLLSIIVLLAGFCFVSGSTFAQKPDPATATSISGYAEEFK